MKATYLLCKYSGTMNARVAVIVREGGREGMTGWVDGPAALSYIGEYCCAAGRVSIC